MSGHQREADERVGWGHSWRNHRIHENAFFEKTFGDDECLFIVADKQRDDRGGRVADLATHFAESIQSIMGDFPQIFYPFGFGKQYVQGCACRGGSRGSGACREDVFAGVVAQVVEHGFIAGNKASD